MIRFFAVAVSALGLSACSSFELPRSFQGAPSAAPTSGPVPGNPRSQYECVTDDGYGRWQPCGNQS
jgi:hypothetical protein